MEIERKWLTNGWFDAEPTRVLKMRQGYVAVAPAVRIRSHQQEGKPTQYILCFKGQGGLSRKEIETEITQQLFQELEDFIEKPLIEKEQRQYLLPNGLILEVNRVDAGLPSEFYYAEIEFETEEQALAWQPEGELAAYLTHEVTDEKGQSMAEYWQETRLK